MVEMKPAQITLAWVICNKGVIIIPKTSSEKRVIENYNSLSIELGSENLSEFDAAFHCH
ncbi:aldo/keto reductase [Bacteroides sp. AN502(2024)]|uniref:aldo/keto reductase n=1 Tax=Bacteroides sp. AN502(2024) TaxID=3160599 RepID=UPI00351399CA